MPAALRFRLPCSALSFFLLLLLSLSLLCVFRCTHTHSGIIPAISVTVNHTHTQLTQTQTERERESELATRNGVGNDAVMAAKSRLLLYYECNCNTQANIAHAVITTVRRYRGKGGQQQDTSLWQGDIFLNSTRLDSTGLTELSVSRGRTGASFASSPN